MLCLARNRSWWSMNLFFYYLRVYFLILYTWRKIHWLCDVRDNALVLLYAPRYKENTRKICSQKEKNLIDTQNTMTTKTSQEENRGLGTEIQNQNIAIKTKIESIREESNFKLTVILLSKYPPPSPSHLKIQKWEFMCLFWYTEA